MPATDLDRSGPSSHTLSCEECVFLMWLHGLRLGGPSTLRVDLGGLAPSDPSSGFGGLMLANTGPEGGLTTSMLHLESQFPVLPFTSLREIPTVGVSVKARASNFLTASACTAPAAPLLPTSADGSDLDLHVISSEFRIHYMTAAHRSVVR